MSLAIRTFPQPGRAAVAALVACFPMTVLVTDQVASLISFLLFIGAFFVLPRARAALAAHWQEVRWVVFAFGLHLAYVALCFALRAETPLSSLEKPSRMLFAASAMMLVVAARPSALFLWRGIIAGALAGAAYITWLRWGQGVDRPGGYMNAITFGDISVSLSMMSLAWASMARKVRDAVWPCLGAVAGLLGAVATGSRGSWLALLAVAVLFVYHRRRIRGKFVRLLALLAVALAIGAFLLPQTGLRERAAEVKANIDAYFSQGGNAYTNVGVRLELWKGAGILIAQHPFFGQDFDTARETLRQMAEKGELDAVALPPNDFPSHVHNDILQNLVAGGIVGLLVWAGTLAAPFLFFAHMFGAQQRASRERTALALGGMLTVSSFFAFGLTDVIFWSVRGAIFYAIMVFLFMGFCLNAKDDEAHILNMQGRA
jgi:O-antigen ligase